MFWIVEVNSKGKYDNWETGIRLFLRRKSAERFAVMCLEEDCNFRLYPLMRLTGDCWGQKVVFDENGFDTKVEIRFES